MSGGTRAEAIYGLVSAYADVMYADPADQQSKAKAWCALRDAFCAEFPDESNASITTYIGLTLMDDEGMGTLPGRVPDHIHQKVAADLFSIQALAEDDQADDA